MRRRSKQAPKLHPLAVAVVVVAAALQGCKLEVKLDLNRAFDQVLGTAERTKGLNHFEE